MIYDSDVFFVSVETIKEGEDWIKNTIRRRRRNTPQFLFYFIYCFWDLQKNKNKNK